ncbi:hypothetical protein VE01_09369 [Pseudogymnoascus verrucosus]|uniref:Uncharacterized protein n=1 Tax=Pseudogymnoascus verrucosus TaxID=342668 RepID=A0A1B8G963_9PEZI|nr:uncharacterized protein VE01_09369 [Pseudogymnoascus verrucosus]OBT92341.1 hypothetical protein VE01_09369 [Pseudogymnoascus verrucosus]
MADPPTDLVPVYVSRCMDRSHHTVPPPHLHRERISAKTMTLTMSDLPSLHNETLEDDLNGESEGDRASVSADEEMSDLNEELEGDMASVAADEEMLDLDEESERDWASVSADEELSLSEPGLDFDDYESDWFILRTKL